MSDAGKRLRTRFGGLRVRVVVPELAGIIGNDSKGEPAVYSTPFTLADSSDIGGYMDDNSPEGYAHVVATKALDEAGQRVFDIADKAILMQCCEAHVVATLAQRLMASVDLEDAVGNSPATRS